MFHFRGHTRKNKKSNKVPRGKTIRHIMLLGVILFDWPLNRVKGHFRGKESCMVHD